MCEGDEQSEQRPKEKHSERYRTTVLLLHGQSKKLQASSVVLTCADAAGLLVKTGGALGVGSRKLCGVNSVLGMKPGTAVGLGIPWPSFLCGFIY